MISLLAQTTTTVPFEAVIHTNVGWSTTISIVALVVATVIGALTVIQGRAIRQIETREHKWQATDRKSAHIQVTRWRENLTRNQLEHTDHVVLEWIRLKNSGRVSAKNVSWKIDFAGEPNPVPIDVPRHLEVLHPGEHFDLSVHLAMSDPSEVAFTVSWEDDIGPHQTERLINL